MSNGTIWSAVLTNDSNGWTGENMVHQFAVANLTLPSGAITQVRITVQAGSSEAVTYTKLYVGHKAAAGDRYDFAATPVAVLFGGSASKVVAAGTQEVSDWVTFAYDKTSSFMLASYMAGGSGSDMVRALGGGAGILLDRKTAADDAATVNKTGYSGYDADSYGIAKIESDGFADTFLRRLVNKNQAVNRSRTF